MDELTIQEQSKRGTYYEPLVPPPNTLDNLLDSSLQAFGLRGCKKMKQSHLNMGNRSKPTANGAWKSYRPRRTSLRVRLQSFLPASGFAMGARATGALFSASVSLPIVGLRSPPPRRCRRRSVGVRALWLERRLGFWEGAGFWSRVYAERRCLSLVCGVEGRCEGPLS